MEAVPSRSSLRWIRGIFEKFSRASARENLEKISRIHRYDERLGIADNPAAYQGTWVPYPPLPLAQKCLRPSSNLPHPSPRGYRFYLICYLLFGKELVGFWKNLLPLNVHNVTLRWGQAFRRERCLDVVLCVVHLHRCELFQLKHECSWVHNYWSGF